MMSVKFGIIGLGGISNRFASVLNSVDGVELAAVASSNLAKAEEFAKKHNAAKASKSYLDLVEDKNVDVVYIGLTHNFHYESIKLCLSHGKGVICEKPMVLTKKDAEELSAIAQDKKLLLMEAMWSRFTPAYIKAKEWVQSGRIGQVKLIHASFCFNFPFDPSHRLFNPVLAGGSLYDAGVYPIEFATGILGENPKQVSGFASICETGVDDYAAFSMRFESGALASLSCGMSAVTNRDACIYGTNGHVVVYDFIGARRCDLLDNNNNLIERFEEDFTDGFIFEVKHFADLFRNGKTESSIMPLKDSIACAGIFDELTEQWAQAGLGTYR
jgi:predicted dehydrogenase